MRLARPSHASPTRVDTDRDGQAPSGYADVNLVLLVEGHLCEVQLLLADFYSLKNEQTPIYDFCRSLGLVGSLPPMAPTPPTAADFSASTASKISEIRGIAMYASCMLAGCYLYRGVFNVRWRFGVVESHVREHMGSEGVERLESQGQVEFVRGERYFTDLDNPVLTANERLIDFAITLNDDPVQILYGLVLALPYLILIHVAWRDAARFAPSEQEAGRDEGKHGYWFMALLVYPMASLPMLLGVFTNMNILRDIDRSMASLFEFFQGMYFGILFLGLFQLPAFLVSLRPYTPRRQSRIGLMYERCAAAAPTHPCALLY